MPESNQIRCFGVKPTNPEESFHVVVEHDEFSTARYSGAALNETVIMYTVPTDFTFCMTACLLGMNIQGNGLAELKTVDILGSSIERYCFNCVYGTIVSVTGINMVNCIKIGQGERIALVSSTANIIAYGTVQGYLIPA